MSEIFPVDWTRPSELPSNTVNVFAARAEPGSHRIAQAYGLLSVAEKERAARFRVEAPRAEFVLGRALLRSVVAGALQTSPEAVPIAVDRYGKPSVPGVHVSVSHSRGLVYVAVSRSGAIGVDVEWLDPALEALELANANFAAEERQYVSKATGDLERVRVFSQLWVRKEALAKAYGRGLQIPLQALRVPFDVRGFAWIDGKGCMDAENRSHSYEVQSLSAPAGYAAALATAAVDCRVIFAMEPSIESRQDA